MNYLALCKRLRQEAGYSGNGPATVDGQTGEMGRIVDWVAASWLTIQTLRDDWRFMLTPFTLSMNSGSNSALLSASAQRLKPDSVVITRPDGAKTFPKEVSIETLRQVQRDRLDNGGYVQLFALDDRDGTLHVFPTLNEDATVAGEYYAKAVTLTANTDVPSLPEQYHLLIVWQALMQAGGYDEAGNVYLRAQENYVALYNQLTRTQTDPLQKAEPLA